MKMLLLGPRYHNTSKVGGVVVLFELFLEELKKNSIEYKVIDTNLSNYSNRIVALLCIYTKFIRFLPNTEHISLHGTALDYKYIAPVIVFLSKIFEKKISLRKFAGNFIEIYEASNFLCRVLINYALKKCDFAFFETKYLVSYFKKFNKNTLWFPNVRRPSKNIRSGAYQKKIIFLGQIRKEKGILELLEVANRLDHSYRVDLYGSMIEPLEEKIKSSKATYKGVLGSHEVLHTLVKYDVLVLPSHREGYPGVVMEAFSVGLPVVATNLEGIKEIVTPKCGILIPPKDKNELELAIKSFKVENYYKFSKAALERFEKFDSEKVTKKVIEVMCESK